MQDKLYSPAQRRTRVLNEMAAASRVFDGPIHGVALGCPQIAFDLGGYPCRATLLFDWEHPDHGPCIRAIVNRLDHVIAKSRAASWRELRDIAAESIGVSV